MAFELMKAKLEAKKARREAIIAIDKYINVLSVGLPDIKDREERKKIEEEITGLVAVKELYKKNTELPKWAQELLTTTLRILAMGASVAACEIITNRGTGDKYITDGIKRLPTL